MELTYLIDIEYIFLLLKRKKKVFDLADISDYSILQSLGAGWHFCLLLASNGKTARKVLSAALKQNEEKLDDSQRA